MKENDYFLDKHRPNKNAKSLSNVISAPMAKRTEYKRKCNMKNNSTFLFFDIFIGFIVSCEKKNIFWRYWRCKFVSFTEMLCIYVRVRLLFELCPNTFRVTEVVIKTIEIDIIETMCSHLPRSTGDEMGSRLVIDVSYEMFGAHGTEHGAYAS